VDRGSWTGPPFAAVGRSCDQRAEQSSRPHPQIPPLGLQHHQLEGLESPRTRLPASRSGGSTAGMAPPGASERSPRCGDTAGASAALGA